MRWHDKEGKMKLSVSMFGILLAFGSLVGRDGFAGGSVVYKCTAPGVTLSILPVDESTGYYLDSLNLGKWKLERPNEQPTFISVQFLIINKDKGIVPIGPLLYSCTGDHEELNVFHNVAERVTSDCSGPGCTSQFRILSGL